MTSEMHQHIRKLMREQGVWNLCQNTKVYKTDEFISEVGESYFSDELKTLLRENVQRVQMYFDDRILEPIGS